MLDRRNLQAFHPFSRLNRLLAGIAPEPGGFLEEVNGGQPLLLQVGEPQHRPPAFVAEELTKAAAGWGRYPPPRGTPDYRAAAVEWLLRRYDLPKSAVAAGGPLDPELAILPLPGSREGLFFAALACVPAPVNGAPPAVLIPDPFYHVYAGAAAAAGAEPVFVPAAQPGGLPDFAALPDAVLARTALCYLCSPSNPEGTVADLAMLHDLIALARARNFVVAFDECYTELYNDAPPPGALQAALARGGNLDNILVFHSLSKRSSAAGLRCGFVAGAPLLIEVLENLFKVGGAGVPLPVLAAGARLWRDEAHVAENRDYYRRNFAVAERVLGNRFDFRTPAGGFFLWLDVGDGEAAATELWRRAGIRVLPGGYMSGLGPGAEAAARHIRIALVYDEGLTEAALRRISETL